MLIHTLHSTRIDRIDPHSLFVLRRLLQDEEIELPSGDKLQRHAIDESKHLGQLRSIYTKFKNEIDNNEQLQGVYKNHEEKINRNKPTDDGWDI